MEQVTETQKLPHTAVINIHVYEVT